MEPLGRTTPLRAPPNTSTIGANIRAKVSRAVGAPPARSCEQETAGAPGPPAARVAGV